jgi:spore germination protein (amino acid permease)
MKEEKISVLQTVMLLTCFLLGTSVILNPAADSGNDAWIAVLIGWAGGYVVFLIVASVASLHPGKSLVGIMIDCFGNRAGKIIGLLYGLFFIWLAGTILHVFGYYEISIEFPETPILFIDICFMVVIAFAVKIGLETLGRMSELFVIFFGFVVFITFASIFTDFHPLAFKPILKDGIMPPLMSGLQSAILPFAEVTIALTIFPNVNNQKKIFKIANITTLVTGAFLFAIMVRNITVVGVDLSGRNIFPAEKVFRLMPGIDVYPLLDLDVIMTGTLKVAVILYAAVRTIGEVFSLKEFKILVFPSAALAVSSSEILIQSIYDQLLSAKIAMIVYIPVFFGMSVILLFVSLIKTRAKEGQTA